MLTAKLTQQDLKEVRRMCKEAGYGRGYEKLLMLRVGEDTGKRSYNVRLFDEPHDLDDYYKLTDLVGEVVELDSDNSIALDILIVNRWGDALDWVYPHAIGVPVNGETRLVWGEENALVAAVKAFTTWGA